jgi:hypothetical protein
VTKTKTVWKIQVNEAGQFWLEDETGKVRWTTEQKQSRFDMAEFAFSAGAEEISHSYDLAKHQIGAKRLKNKKEG